MLEIILIIIGIAIAVVLILAAMQPTTFRVSRSKLVHAPAEEPFTRLVDLRRWKDWSPFEKLDPSMKKEFSGPESGVGAAYAWDGNKKAGAGRIEIVDADPPHRLDLDLTFTRPFKASNKTDFVLQPVESGTHVSWTMHGTNTFVGKVMCVFVNMDRMIGKDFEEGLENLKRESEAASTRKETSV